MSILSIFRSKDSEPQETEDESDDSHSDDYENCEKCSSKEQHKLAKNLSNTSSKDMGDVVEHAYKQTTKNSLESCLRKDGVLSRKDGLFDQVEKDNKLDHNYIVKGKEYDGTVLSEKYDSCKECGTTFVEGNRIYLTSRYHDLDISIPYPYCRNCIKSRTVAKTL